MNSYWDLLQPHMTDVDIYTGPKQYASSIAGLQRSVVLLYASHMLLAEVHNGGLLQLFWNNTGIVNPEAIEGFQAMGMPKFAGLLGGTALKLGTPYPRDREQRWDALLRAAECSEKQLSEMFERTAIGLENIPEGAARASAAMYRGFLEATQPLGFDAIRRQMWLLAERENGGYQDAATAYANRASRM